MGVRAVSISLLLKEQYGGTWKHRSFTASWECDDGKRHAHRVCMCGHDGDCNCGGQLFIYEDGRTPIHVQLATVALP